MKYVTRQEIYSATYYFLFSYGEDHLASLTTITVSMKPFSSMWTFILQLSDNCCSSVTFCVFKHTIGMQGDGKCNRGKKCKKTNLISLSSCRRENPTRSWEFYVQKMKIVQMQKNRSFGPSMKSPKDIKIWKATPII